MRWENLNIDDLRQNKANLMKLIKNKELCYIDNDKKYKEIVEHYVRLNQGYLKSYIKNHTDYASRLKEILKNLKDNPSWNFILKLSENSKEIEEYYDKKYSIKKISTQLKSICERASNDLTEDINLSYKCTKCQLKLEDFQEVGDFNNKSASEDITKNILEKMKDSNINSILDEKIINKYNKTLKNNPNSINSLLGFYESLENDEKTQFINLVLKFLQGLNVEIVDINEIIRKLRLNKSKYYGIDDFFKAFKNEFLELANQNSNKSKIEWIFQL